MTKTKKDKPEEKLKDDSVFSKNHSKSVKYRIRKQQEKEADDAIKEYDDEDFYGSYGGTD
jgi:hypothetical protein